MVTLPVRWRRVMGPIARHGRQERSVARAWALLAFLVFVTYWFLIGPIESPEGPGGEQVLQVVFALGGLFAIALAWRSELLGGVLLTASALALGVVAAVAFPPGTAFVVALFYLGPGLLFLVDWASRHAPWQAAVLAVAVVLALGAGGLSAQSVHHYYFGPAHPQSTLVALPDSPVEWVWAGAVTPRSAQVNAKLRAESARVRLAVSTDPTFAAPSYSPVAAASEAHGRVVALVAQGLEPGTRYHYAVEADGALDLVRAGSFATFAEGPQSLVVAFSSCARVGSNGAVFDAIREAQPDLYLALGDIHYANIESNSRARFRDALDRLLTAPAQAALYREVPVGYVWDDHDFGGNNSSGSSESREAAQLTYREYVPHYRAVGGEGAAPIHQAFTVGRVRVILTDGRSARGLEDLPGGEPSMLGAAQREWLVAELVEASRSHALVVWGNPQPWIAGGSAGDDDWGGYVAERRLIAERIAAEGIENLVMLSGDAHMLAIDDGTNAGYADGGTGGFPVMHAAALDRPGSAKGGPYSEGTLPGAGQFGLMSITDDGGDTVEVAWSGQDWRGDQLIAHRFTVAVPSGARVPVAAAAR